MSAALEAPGLATDAGVVHVVMGLTGAAALLVAVCLEGLFRRVYEPNGRTRLDMHNEMAIEALFAEGESAAREARP